MPRKPAKHPAKPKRGKKLEVEEPGVLYGRYSSHNQKDISVEQQFEKGCELAAEYGIRIIDTYADRAVSGRTDKRRDFQRMMTDAAKGKFRYVIAWKSNRMGRNMLEALINEARLQDLGVRVLYVEEDFDDTAAGRFAARSMMNVNQFYSENMAEDIKRGLYDNAANCMVANGHLPYGYKADETLHYAIDEPKAAVIREIFTRVSCGEAFVDIMASLNARGIKTSYGRPWGRSSFQKILSNERYRGIYIYGDVRKEGGIPRIISDELYFKVQEVITTKKNPQGRHRVNGDYLLTGKLFCGHCKSPMTGISGTSRSGNLHYYYVCQKRRTEKTCEKKNLRRDDIELQVAKAIKRRTLDDDTINWIADSVVEYSQHQESASGIGLLEDQLKDTQRSIKNLIAAIEQGIITPTTKARLMELEKEQSDIDRKITMAKADVIPVNRDQLVGWLKKLQAGDVHDKKYQAELFDTFLIAVYVYDNPDGQDYMKVVFNYAGSKNTVEIPLDPSVIDNVENIETGAVRLSSAQVHHKSRRDFSQIAAGFCVDTLMFELDREVYCMKKVLSVSIKTIIFFVGWAICVSVIPIPDTASAVIWRFWAELIPLLSVIAITFIFWLTDQKKIRLHLTGKSVYNVILGGVTGAIWLGASVGILSIIGVVQIEGKNQIDMLWLWLISALLNTVMQEMLVRGYLYQMIKSNGSIAAAIIVSTGLFTVAHGGAFEAGILPVLNVITMSLFMTAVLEYTGSLIAPIVIHFLWNGVGAIILGGVSLAEDYPHLFDMTIHGNPILSGGSCKIEDSIIVLFMNLAFLIGFVAAKKRRERNT